MSPHSYTNIQPVYLQAAEELRGNPGQWKAYESKGNCVVLAGPGSGKTKLLAIKMARLIHEDIRAPQGIACITYSSECARELKKRLDSLGIEEKRNIFIGTIHSFCLNHIVRPYAKIAGFPIPDPIKVVDSDLWDNLFDKSVQKVGLGENPFFLKTTFDRYRRTYLDRSNPEFRNSSAEQSRLIECFENELHKAGYIDFDDMVLIGLWLVQRHNWIRQAIKSRFPIVVIDEYQDLGMALHQLVLKLVFDAGVRVFAVGDPDQSIYGFTGAQPLLLKNLSECPQVEAVELRYNYRCAKKIVANSVIALGEYRDYESKSDENGDIFFWECPEGTAQQVEIICNNIIPTAIKAKEGRTLGDIAVLYLDKYDAARITAAVKSAGMNYIGGDRDANYRQTPVTRWLEDCAAWCSGGWKEGSPRLSAILRFWLGLFENTESKLEEKVLRQRMVGFLWGQRDPKACLKDWIEKIVALGLVDSLAQVQTRTDEAEALAHLIKTVNDPSKMGNFNILAFGNLRGSPDHLNLVTLHSSKGLEFDVVIMMGLEQGRIPRYSVTTEMEFLEERRKFYVGLTRAKREVHLLYSGWYENYRGTRFKKGPSEFVLEQGAKYEEQDIS